MPDTDQGPLGPEIEERLRRELDAITPQFSSPRYLTAGRRPFAWRLAPVALAAALVGIVGLTAYAGSPNPIVWTQHVFTVIHPAAASPKPAEPTTGTSPSPTPGERESPEPSQSPEPNESPEPKQSPEPRESPEPSGGGSGGESSNTSGDR